MAIGQTSGMGHGARGLRHPNLIFTGIVIMLLTLACEYRELYDTIGARLHPRSALALAHTCARLRVCMHAHACHYVRFAPILHAIGRVEYYLIHHVYSGRHINRYKITPIAACESVRVLPHKTTITYDNIQASAHAHERLFIVDLQTGFTTRIGTYNGVIEIVDDDALPLFWSTYYAWTTRQLQLHHMMYISHVRATMISYLYERARRTLACVNYADFANIMQAHAAVHREPPYLMHQN